MSVSSWIVPPITLAFIYGFDAVEITVKKAHLIKDGKRIESAFYTSKDTSMQSDFGAWVEFVKAHSLQVIRSVHVENNGGFTFGMDSITPVSFVFSNKPSANVYDSFGLGDFADFPKVQEWIKQQNFKAVMSKNELIQKIISLSNEV